MREWGQETKNIKAEEKTKVQNSPYIHVINKSHNDRQNCHETTY